MPKLQLHLMAAACENMGIGLNGTLPWRLKKELDYFTMMTSKVEDPSKRNVVIMGRKTWDSIPVHRRPLCDRINVVLTHHVDEFKTKVSEDVVVVPSLDDAVKHIEGRDDVESTWVIGGSSVYKEAMDHPKCGKIYLTEIEKDFECDTFFPDIDQERFHLVDEEGIPTDKQTEGDISYYYRVYKKV